MVIWLCSPRAQTKDRSYQGTDTAQGSFSRVSCTLMPSLGSTSHPQFSHCPGHVLLSLSTEWIRASPSQLEGEDCLSYSHIPLAFCSSSQSQCFITVLACLTFSNPSLSNCSGCFVPHLIPVLLPVWHILNISSYSNWGCHLFIHLSFHPASQPANHAIHA